MTPTRYAGLLTGLALLAATFLLPPPAGMSVPAWHVAGLTALMAAWWMTEAVPLTVTAFAPFVLLPAFGVMNMEDSAAAYWSPILFLFVGGSMLALAVERTGLHRRVAAAIVARAPPSPAGLLAAFMLATAAISGFASNTATALILLPMATAALAAGQIGPTTGNDRFGGTLAMGVAFSATIGGFATLVGSPTNGIAAALTERTTGAEISFLTWASYGVPLVLLALPVAWALLCRLGGLASPGFDVRAARAALAGSPRMSPGESRVALIFGAVAAGWILLPLLAPEAITDRIGDGTVALIGAALLFVVPDGTGRPLLTWDEADRTPWGVILMFGGGLALAAGIGESGLARWLGDAFAPLRGLHPVVIALLLTLAIVILTEFASNVASASAAMPVVGGVILATGVDPLLLAMPAAFAASWGFMMPAGTGPNALAWATGRIHLPRMLKTGFALDLLGAPLIVGVVWAISALR